MIDINCILEPIIFEIIKYKKYPIIATIIDDHQELFNEFKMMEAITVKRPKIKAPFVIKKLPAFHFLYFLAK